MKIKRIAAAYTVSTVSTLTTTAAAVWLAGEFGYSIRYDTTAVAVWLAGVGIPSVMHSGRHLYKTLGYRPPVAAAGTVSQGINRGRAVPIHGGKSGHVFLFGGPSPSRDTPATPPPLPDVFTVSGVTWSAGMEPLTIQFSEIEVRNWLDAVWKRQTGDDSHARRYPMSRRYFTQRWKPRLDFSEYYGLVTLCDLAGIIVNRRHGRSGKLLLQPRRAIKQIQWSVM